MTLKNWNVLFLVIVTPIKMVYLLGFHSPQPHLDGGYTVFGRVSEKDMKIVDSIVRGDKILSVKIVEASVTTPKTTGRQRSKTKR
jgi:cyclophilin family peptidyl-prolyl cis-trans isomerase